MNAVKSMEYEASHEAQNGDVILAQDEGDADNLNTRDQGEQVETLFGNQGRQSDT